MEIKKVLPQGSAAAGIFGRFEREIPRGKVDEETRRVCILATLAACAENGLRTARICGILFVV